MREMRYGATARWRMALVVSILACAVSCTSAEEGGGKIRVLTSIFPLKEFAGAVGGDRVRVELLKLLAAPDPATVVGLMRDEGVLDHFLAHATAIGRLDRMVAIEAALGLNDPLRRLAALLPVDADTALHLAQGLRLSKAERGRLVAMAEPEEAVTPDMDGPARRRALYRLGAATWADLVLIAWADGTADPSDVGWRGLIAETEGWERPKFPVTGADVKRLGVAESASVGEMLRAVESWWIEGDFTADRKECLGRLESLVGCGP